MWVYFKAFVGSSPRSQLEVLPSGDHDLQGCDILKLQPYLRFLVQIRKRLEGSGLNRELTRLARCRQVLK